MITPLSEWECAFRITEAERTTGGGPLAERKKYKCTDTKTTDSRNGDTKGNITGQA